MAIELLYAIYRPLLLGADIFKWLLSRNNRMDTNKCILPWRSHEPLCKQNFARNIKAKCCQNFFRVHQNTVKPYWNQYAYEWKKKN